MSKRKQSSEERRRPTPEINLLAGAGPRKVFGKARKGCSIPFLGGTLAIVVVFALVHTV